MRIFYLISICILGLQCLYAQNLPSGFDLTQVATGLDPTAIKISPDNRVFITEKNGAIYVVKNGDFIEEPFMTLDVDQEGERGLQNIAFDPDFVNNGIFYAYYCSPGLHRNVLSKFESNADKGILESEEILVTGDSLTSNFHNGGSLFFGNDGKLYLFTGDGGDWMNPQRLSNVLGKVLRLNKDGSAPEDNPFYNTLTGQNRLIYAYGLRNPYKAYQNPANGEIYFNDVGGGEYEEINKVEAGKNYGWPFAEGFNIDNVEIENYQDPLYAYYHETDCAAITAGTYFPSGSISFPPEYGNKIFFADVCHGWINTFDEVSGDIDEFATGFNQPLDIVYGEDGSMYVLTRSGSEMWRVGFNGVVWRINYSGSGDVSLAQSPQDFATVENGNAVFTVLANGDEPISYQWQKNGIDIPGENNDTLILENVQLSDNLSQFRVLVTNGSSIDTSEVAKLIVSDNSMPEAVIISPQEGEFYSGGQTILFSGEGFDEEDGLLDASSFSWAVDFHHNVHTHPVITEYKGSKSGSFSIPEIGETSSNVWFRVYLKVTDYEGFTTTVYRDIYPVIHEVTINTIPQNFKITLDGKVEETPITFQSVEGIKRIIGVVSSQYADNIEYNFQNWNNLSESPTQFFAAIDDTLLTANFDILTGTYTSRIGNTIAYPNPVTEALHIIVNALTSGVSVLNIVDLYGRNILSKELDLNSGENLIELNLSDIKTGVYILNISNAEGSVLVNQEVLISR